MMHSPEISGIPDTIQKVVFELPYESEWMKLLFGITSEIADKRWENNWMERIMGLEGQW